MNLANTVENLSISIISFVVGVALGSFVVFQTTNLLIKSNQAVLIEAIHKESTSIKNDYDIKNKKGSLHLQDKNLIMKDSNKTIHWWNIRKHSQED